LKQDFWKKLKSLFPNLTPRQSIFFYHIDLAEQTNDPKLLKKLQNDIWEFRTKYGGLQIRLLAFWDKTDMKETLIVATHGFIIKIDKVQKNEIDRALRLKYNYFNNKKKE
jgi:hypothetical protein